MIDDIGSDPVTTIPRAVNITRKQAYDLQAQNDELLDMVTRTTRECSAARVALSVCEHKLCSMQEANMALMSENNALRAELSRLKKSVRS